MEQERQSAPSIRDLQHMLDRLSRRFPQLPRLSETGVFDELTLEAVMVFQRDFGLPVTGAVDHDTWYAVVEAYRNDLLHYGAPSLLRVLPDGEFRAGAGQSGEPVRIAQAMLCALSRSLANFPQCQTSQVNEGGTLHDLRQLQKLAGLPETGELNRATWEFLTRLYHIYVTRDVLSTQAGQTASSLPGGGGGTSAPA